MRLLELEHRLIGGAARFLESRAVELRGPLAAACPTRAA